MQDANELEKRPVKLRNCNLNQGTTYLVAIDEVDVERIMNSTAWVDEPRRRFISSSGLSRFPTDMILLLPIIQCMFWSTTTERDSLCKLEYGWRHNILCYTCINNKIRFKSDVWRLSLFPDRINAKFQLWGPFESQFRFFLGQRWLWNLQNNRTNFLASEISKCIALSV